MTLVPTAPHVPPAPSRRHAVLGAALASLGPLPTLGAEFALESDRGRGYTLSVPASYYRPSSRSQTGQFDDTLQVYADYAAGRTVSVWRTPAVALLVDSGDPIPLLAGGQLQELRELGKPQKVAALLMRRRDGDPESKAPPKSFITSVERPRDDELRFSLLTLTSSATSATTASPTARSVQARSIFVAGEKPYLLTVWASSPAPASAAACVPDACDRCGEGSSLSCECPAPKCEVNRDSPADAMDVAIVESLRAGSGARS